MNDINFWLNSVRTLRSETKTTFIEDIYLIKILDFWQQYTPEFGIVNQATTRFYISCKEETDLLFLENFIKSLGRTENAVYTKYYYLKTTLLLDYFDSIENISKRGGMVTQTIVSNKDVERDIRASFRFIKNK